MEKVENNKYKSKQIKEILDSIRLNTLLHITKDGKIDCPEADNFIAWIDGYAKYCIPEMQEKWKEAIRKILNGTIVPKPKYQSDTKVQEIVISNDYTIIDNLYNFINAGEIMQTYEETKSWEEVNKIVDKQGHSGWTLSGLLNIMIQYSLIGVEFVDLVDQDRINRDESFKKLYDEAKSYNDNRTELNKRLIVAITPKNNQN